MVTKQPLNFSFKESIKNYIFSEILNNAEKDLSVIPQHKIGNYYIDRTKTYQEKYSDNNVTKVLEEYEVECWYKL